MTQQPNFNTCASGKLIVSSQSKRELPFCGEYIKSSKLRGVWIGPRNHQIRDVSEIAELQLKNVRVLEWIVDDDDPIICYVQNGDEWEPCAFDDPIAVEILVEQQVHKHGKIQKHVCLFLSPIKNML